MKKKAITLLCTVALLGLQLSTTALALEESEVESAISASSQQAVSGNVFIWFLCAVAFLKISQKIDSFMTSLGINVGRTGGSMIGELMIAGRALGVAASATGGALGNIFNRGHSSTSVNNQKAAGENFSAGTGLAGVAMRAAAPAAVANVTGKGRGIRNSIMGAVVDSSINSGGEFGAGVVGAVAKGNLARDGSITGTKAAQALTSYLGYQTQGATLSPTEGAQIDAAPPGTDTTPIAGQGIPTAVQSGEDVVTLDGGMSAAANATGVGIGTQPITDALSSGVPSSSSTGTAIGADAGIGGSATARINAGAKPISTQPPTFRDVEIGGGRISGYEMPAGGGEERQFAMYSASQYMQPTGPYETVQTADGESWYKQYAQPTVQKTPYKGDNGKIQYREQIVAEMPQVPKRKDRI